jgi:glycosyltransferase involved in cell wall biosynthesis
MKSVSIVMATYNKAKLLRETLKSIVIQGMLRPTQLIVVDDGSTDNGATRDVCKEYGAEYHYLDRPGYCNPAAARNVGYKAATGDIVIAQSSDVFHKTPDAIERLCRLTPGTFNIATVVSLDAEGQPKTQYTGTLMRRPFFFLGSLRREDLYAIGGDDEDFEAMGCEDEWFADRLMCGLKLEPQYRPDIIACHQWHRRPRGAWQDRFAEADAVLKRKRREAQETGHWVASGGKWEM